MIKLTGSVAAVVIANTATVSSTPVGTQLG